MASKVAIANYALAGELGKDQITALTDTTKAAEMVNLLFDITAQEVMAEGAWSSATKRQTLAQDATAPDWGYLYRYTLPTDPKFLGLLKVNELLPGDSIYSVESGFLLTDDTTMKIQYKIWQTDTEKWDMNLQRAVVLKLAAKLCYSLTGNVELKKTLLAEYQEALDSGLSLDATNSSDDDFTVTDDLKVVRYGVTN